MTGCCMSMSDASTGSPASGSTQNKVPLEEPSHPELDTDRDVLQNFYLENPPLNRMITTDFLKLIRVTSGQRGVYFSLGKVDPEPWEEGTHFLWGWLELWGSVVVVDVTTERKSLELIHRVQAKGPLDLPAAYGTLQYKVTDPVKTITAVGLDYPAIIEDVGQADLRRFIGSKTLDDLVTLPPGQIDAASDETKKYARDSLGIEIQKILFEGIDLPPELEREIAQKTIAAEEAKGRLELADVEIEIAGKYAKAAEHYRDHPEAMELRRLQSLDNLVETQKANPNLFIGIDPMLGLLGKAAKRE